MDAAHIFRQGLGTVGLPRQHQPAQLSQQRRPTLSQALDDDRDDVVTGSGPRIAHTLTACCRCRQRKTRCDPTLPRCLPCERSGSTCEYLDTAKGRKINRYYVIKLQDKVKALEAELGQYIDEDGDSHGQDDMTQPGGMVRLYAGDDTPRYLGPSSGISMTRMLIEEAKRYTDSNRISDLIPEVKARRTARMQSIQMTSSASGRRSYPITSECAIETLPTRAITDKLIEIFNQKAQLLCPVLHERALQSDLEAVYAGDTDPYKNLIVRMVIAISLQKLDTQYAGLADSYFLAAMGYVEDAVRPKDLKTLQCLVLIGQYSMLTPTRTPVYYVIGLATKICQQEGLTDEQTIKTGYNLDPLTIDLRRRLAWIVASMEYTLAHCMGRPTSYATGNDQMDVEFFTNVPDANISENGITPGPPSNAKLVAIHYCKSRMIQAEICRTLYEKKRLEPKTNSHPWYQRMETRLKEWLDAAPTEPQSFHPWFAGFYHSMKLLLYRPSPQIPKPSAQAAEICFESSSFLIDLSKKQMEGNAPDVSWIFLSSLTTSLNTLLWTISLPEIRQAHPRETVEGLVETALGVLDSCSTRWPGTSASCELYGVFSKACLLSYDAVDPLHQQQQGQWSTLPTITEPSQSPDGVPPTQGVNQQQVPYINPPQFNYVFDGEPEPMNNYALDPNFPPPQMTFRSNSIFRNPASSDSNGRRFSYFPPDFTQMDDSAAPDASAASAPDDPLASPPDQLAQQLPTPPESLVTGTMTTPTSVGPLTPGSMGPTHTPNVQQTPLPMQASMSPAHKHDPLHVQSQITPTAPAPTSFPTSQPAPPQRPLPTTTDWYTPPVQPFVHPFQFGAVNSNFLSDVMAGPNGFGDAPINIQGLTNANGGPFGQPPGRQGSLTQSQQLELMNVLETEGASDIDALLSANATPDRWM